MNDALMCERLVQEQDYRAVFHGTRMILRIDTGRKHHNMDFLPGGLEPLLFKQPEHDQANDREANCNDPR